MILDWDEYFMGVAKLTALRSKDPSTQVGSVLVNEYNHIIATGYNGFPRGIGDSDLPWEKVGEFLDTKYAYVCHSEASCLANRGSNAPYNAKLYTTLFPCNECSKLIIQNGIVEVIYFSDKYHDRNEFIASRKMLDLAHIKYRQFNLNKITI